MQFPVVNPYQQVAAGPAQVANLRPQAPQAAAEPITVRAVRGTESSEGSAQSGGAAQRPSTQRQRGSLVDVVV